VAGLSYLHADFTTHTYAPHAHDGFVIAVTETGGSEFHSRGQTAEATQATLLVFNPDEPHSGRMGRSTRWRYRSLYLETPAAAALMGSLGLAGSVGFTRNVLHDPDLIAGFLDLHAARDAGRDALEQRERLVESFGALFSKYADGGNRIPVSLSEHGTVGKVIALMRERYAETLTLEQMSAPVGLTPFQLIGLFKRSVGLTPHAQLTQLRLKAATRALRTGATLADAAVGAGFYDQSALNKHFKRCYGITPRQYIRAFG
jgi:AraC-like DNA-binding protein